MSIWNSERATAAPKRNGASLSHNLRIYVRKGIRSIENELSVRLFRKRASQPKSRLPFRADRSTDRYGQPSWCTREGCPVEWLAPDQCLSTSLCPVRSLLAKQR